MNATNNKKEAAKYTTRSILISCLAGLAFFVASAAFTGFAVDDTYLLIMQIVAATFLATTLWIYRLLSRLERQHEQTVAARDKAEEGLKSQQITAIVSDRMRGLGEMATSLAHELNQPLTGIRGMTEHLSLNLERDWQIDKDKIQAKLLRIMQQTDRITELIEHVRTFAKESNIPDSSPTSLNQAARRSTEIFGAQLEHHGIALRMELDENLPLVQANPFAIEEVLFALVANARDSYELKRPPEAVWGSEPYALTIKTSRQIFGGAKWAKLEVSDNGGGMSEEVAERAFDLFFTTKEPNKGTGLGLSVARSIIERFGGTVDLLSTLDEGTTVTILLPEATGDESQGGPVK